MSGKLIGLISQWFNATMGVKDLRGATTDERIAAADRLADAEASYEVADPAPTLPDLWAAERAIIDLPDDQTIDDWMRSSLKPPAGAAAPGSAAPRADAVAAPPSATPAEGGAGGSTSVDDAALARVIAPVLRYCEVHSPHTTAEIVAREITHFFDVTARDG